MTREAMDMNSEPDTTPRTKAELMARITREWAALEEAVAYLGEEQLSLPDAGGWSVKDHLAHLAAWEQYMLSHYIQGRPAHEAMGVDEATYAAADEDGINDILYRRNRERPVGDILADWRRSHRVVLDHLWSVPFEELRKPLDPDDPQKRPVINWVIGNTYEHYQEHRGYIQRILERG